MGRLNYQKYVNKKYPPTMTFDTKTLKPTNVLKERVELISEFAPDFFCGKRLLDIGCSKGYFSLKYADRFDEVVGLDADYTNIQLCNGLKKRNTQFVCCSFRDFLDFGEFDRIWIGNTAHHLFLDCHGWEWIAKLAALSSDMVLVEGPMDTGCRDMQKLIPSVLHRMFDRFLAEMNRHFWLEKTVATVSYTPDRYLMLFHRKSPLRVDHKKLGIVRMLKADGEFNVYATRYYNKLRVAKVCKRPIKLTMMLGRLANMSPVTNGCVAEIWDDGRYVGWLEDYHAEKPYRYFENEETLWQRHIRHQLFLLRNGLIDMDCATINFFRVSNLLFDKSVVYPAMIIPDRHIDYYFINLNHSFRTISKSDQETLRRAMETRNSRQIEDVYRKMLK